jgi:hypothetical protein
MVVADKGGILLSGSRGAVRRVAWMFMLTLSSVLVITAGRPAQATTSQYRWYAGTEATATKYGVKATVTVPATRPYVPLGESSQEWVTVDNHAEAWVQTGWFVGPANGIYYNSPTAYIESGTYPDSEIRAYGPVALNSSHTFQIDWSSSFLAWRVLIDSANKGYFNGGAMNAPQWISAKGETTNSSCTMGRSRFNPVKYANSSLVWYSFSSAYPLEADSPYHVSGYPYNFENWGP